MSQSFIIFKNTTILAKTAIVLVFFLVIACTQNTPNTQSTTQSATTQTQNFANTHDLGLEKNSPNATHINTTHINKAQIDTPQISPIKNADGTISIDWSLVDSRITPSDTDSYNYPILLDSLPVQNYAKAFDTTAQQAQHAMVLSMASPELINKVLDQLSDEYLGHRFMDGAKPVLVIYTTDKVTPSEFSYIIADSFGKGLSLPVQIRPKTATDSLDVDIQKLSKSTP